MVSLDELLLITLIKITRDFRLKQISFWQSDDLSGNGKPAGSDKQTGNQNLCCRSNR